KAEDGIRDRNVTGVQTCALPISFRSLETVHPSWHATTPTVCNTMRGNHMSYLLHIDSSSLDEASISRQVASSFREVWDGPVVHRDLAAAPVPHLSAAGVTARITAPNEHTAEQAAAIAIQDELIEEFLGASAYLFTVPMYNLTMPSVRSEEHTS